MSLCNELILSFIIIEARSNHYNQFRGVKSPELKKTHCEGWRQSAAQDPETF